MLPCTALVLNFTFLAIVDIWTLLHIDHEIQLYFDTGSVILVLMALITYWNKKKNTLSERSTVLY